MEKDSKSSNKLEELKNKIYSRHANLSPKPRKKIKEEPHVVSDTWKEEDKPAKSPKKPSNNLLKSSMFKKVFFGALIFFLLSVVFGLYMFFGESNTVSANNIDISVQGNAFTSGGEDLPLQIQISNRNSVALEATDLRIEYQKGAGTSEGVYRERVGLGNISAGSVTRELVNVVVFGQQGTTRDILIALEYRVPGSNAIFVKERVYTVNISSAPVNLVVSGPTNSGSNQNVSFSVKTNLNTPNAVKNMMVMVEYPRGFDFKSANPAPTFGDNIWILGDLNPGVEREIKINGVIVAQAGDQRAFNVYVGQQLDVNERQMGTQFNSQSYVVAIQKPLLDTTILVNGNSAPEVSVSPGSNTQVRIDWRNSTNQRINDVEIVAEISGPLVNYPTISTTNGFYESSTNRIIWNRQNYPGFADVRPSQSGSLTFNFQTLTPTEAAETSIVLSIKARDPVDVNQFLDIRNFDRKILRVATRLQMVGHALYNSGSFTNSGPLPPTPGAPTTYTISWSLVNSINDVANAEVRGRLPIYVDFVGLTSPSSESVTYNQTTKEVIWNAGNVLKNTGSISSPREVQFQVRFNPSSVHSGRVVSLVEGISYKGMDVMTNSQISNNAPNITTELNKDLNYNPENDKVQ
jgi:hypothetical protein